MKSIEKLRVVLEGEKLVLGGLGLFRWVTF